MGFERKIKRNEIRHEYGNKGLKAEWKTYQVHKYGLEEYAKMQKKTVNELLKEKVL